MLTGLELFGIIAGCILLYMMGIGISHRIMYKYSNLDWDDSLIVSVFFWYLVSPVVATRQLCITIPKKIVEYRNKRLAEAEKKKEMPPIYVKKGARIETMDTYKQLKQLCTDFEIEFEANKEVDKFLGQ